MKFLFSLFATTILWSAFAQTSPLWLRYPAISPDGSQIVFTYKGDLYKVSANGGLAYPLTLHEAHDFRPVWSNDGKQIAFASDRYGNFDVFVMPAEGGEAKRLTYHSLSEIPYCFKPDNKTVIYGGLRQDAPENRQFPAGYLPELYSTSGGRPSRVLTTPAADVQYLPGGGGFYYHDVKGQENTWRKHHTSSVTADIWYYDLETQAHKKISSFVGEDRNPVWHSASNTLYYLSEASGSFNIFTTNGQGENPTQVTHFKTHPVRFLSSAQNGTLCFGYGGEIYTLKNGVSTKLAVQIMADARSNQVKNVSMEGGVSQMVVAPNGREVAYVFRGDVFVSNADGSGTRQITKTPGAESNISWHKDGRMLVYCSERNGRFRIFKTELQRKEDPYFYTGILLTETELVQSTAGLQAPKLSPNGQALAYTEGSNTLKVLNLTTGSTKTLVSAKEWISWGDGGHQVAWSPDSYWLLVSYAEPSIGNSEVGILSADGSTPLTNLSQNGFADYDPKWILNGRAISWLSNRDGLAAKANSGGGQSDVYALFLNKAAYDTFLLTKDDLALAKEMQEKRIKGDSSQKKNQKKDTVQVLKIDWAGLEYRKERLTTHSSDLGDALVASDGVNLYYLSRFEDGLNLWTTNLKTKETKVLAGFNAQNADNMQWSGDGKKLFLQLNGGIAKVDVSNGSVENLTIAANISIDLTAERINMFNHVVRRTNDIFYKQGFHNANWQQLAADYAKQVPYVGNNYEFSELLSELLGELNVSHSGAAYMAANSNGDATASLGVLYDFGFKGPGYKVAEILPGAPVDLATDGLQAGTIIEAIDGDTLSIDTDISQLLNRKSGKPVLLSLLENGTRRELVVKPITLAQEGRLLYRRWTKRNADEVLRLSNGALGYVHIPSMSDGPYRTTLEQAMGKYAGKKALVVDTRNNGGGDLVADLAMWLSGSRFLENSNDREVVNYEPTFRWNKPSISLVNEANYSDGHCYAFAYQYLKIGKLLGAPVPGTCTFAGWEMLQDPSIRWGVPPMGVRTMGGQYLENQQTEPDIKLLNAYQQVARGTDQQLEAAVAELLKVLL